MNLFVSISNYTTYFEIDQICYLSNGNRVQLVRRRNGMEILKERGRILQWYFLYQNQPAKPKIEGFFSHILLDFSALACYDLKPNR